MSFVYNNYKCGLGTTTFLHRYPSTGFASPPAEHPGPHGCPVTTLASIINALVHRARITMVNESGTEMKTVLMVLTVEFYLQSGKPSNATRAQV